MHRPGQGAERRPLGPRNHQAGDMGAHKPHGGADMGPPHKPQAHGQHRGGHDHGHGQVQGGHHQPRQVGRELPAPRRRDADAYQPARHEPRPEPAGDDDTTCEQMRQQIVQAIKKSGAKEPADCKVEITEGKMEFIFPYNGLVPVADVQRVVTSFAGRREKVTVGFLKQFMVIHIPDYSSLPNAQDRIPYSTEVMIPLDKKGKALVHSQRRCFSTEEVDLCVQVYKAGSEEAKVKQAAGGGKDKNNAMNLVAELGDDPTVEEVAEKLLEMGVEVFMPAVISPALNSDMSDSKKGIRPETCEKLWGNIAGYENVKASVKQCITLPLLRPDLFQRMALLARGEAQRGGKRTNGVLFTGPPGVGKTSMAKVASHAAGIPLVYVPVEGIMSKWYGEAEQRLRSVFDLTRKLGRAVLFLDELDAFAGSRENNMHEATRRILSVLLRQLDGLDMEEEEEAEKVTTKYVVTVGATNRPDDLDAALLSRFDQSIHFPLPSEYERGAIFGTYAAVLSKEQCAELAKVCPGFAGRDIVECCRQAERLWLYQLLNGDDTAVDMSVSDLKPPPIKIYLEAVQTRIRQTGVKE
eukprot:NODE_34_length_2249_cov_103.780455_g17_i0.p1 GENE.NODE_34_length_2249_cov_103.780455_g17_i0~~NODE_34_length_2249_cov_103.780455_g17_i0.p1  ORF type:complete len:580 (-),score=148.91 NODE_34_length_2249_cov_103.780455_g17_i0:476-2215(-)